MTMKIFGLLRKMLATFNINGHIKHIYTDSELQEEATIWKFRIVRNEGSHQVERKVNRYNLQVIIA